MAGYRSPFSTALAPAVTYFQHPKLTTMGKIHCRSVNPSYLHQQLSSRHTPSTIISPLLTRIDGPAFVHDLYLLAFYILQLTIKLIGSASCCPNTVESSYPHQYPPNHHATATILQPLFTRITVTALSESLIW